MSKIVQLKKVTIFFDWFLKRSLLLLLDEGTDNITSMRYPNHHFKISPISRDINWHQISLVRNSGIGVEECTITKAII